MSRSYRHRFALPAGGGRAAALAAVLGAAVLWAGGTAPARAETLREALAVTYVDNPELDAARAELRAIDENVPQALSGYRPHIAASAEISRNHIETTTLVPPTLTRGSYSPRSFAITVAQPVFRGFRTLNSTRQADALVYAGREALLNTEQNVLIGAVEAYVDVLRDRSIVELRRNNLKVLREQLRATQDRFSVGEVTRTDVAQAEARLSLAVSMLNAAQAALNSSAAIYKRVIGHEPARLTQPGSVAAHLPRSLDEALLIADAGHPAIRAATYSEQAAAYGVDVTTGELLPTVTVEGTYSKSYETSLNTGKTEFGSITGRLNVPIYQAGSVSSRVRQARQVRSQRLLELDLARRQVRAAVVSAWGQYDAAKAQIASAQAQIEANEVALRGVREEADVGQRTVLDVLDAEQALLDSRVSLVTSRRDLVLAAYALLSAVGRLGAERLNLAVVVYDPVVHYLRVRNKWFGLGD